jgi:hypothetical protein
MYADLEYDHLDYSRPGTSWKPHYQRMANGFEPHSKDTTNKDRADSADWYIASWEFCQRSVHPGRPVPLYKTEGRDWWAYNNWIVMAVVPICGMTVVLVVIEAWRSCFRRVQQPMMKLIERGTLQ